MFQWIREIDLPETLWNTLFFPHKHSRIMSFSEVTIKLNITWELKFSIFHKQSYNEVAMNGSKNWCGLTSSWPEPHQTSVNGCIAASNRGYTCSAESVAMCSCFCSVYEANVSILHKTCATPAWSDQLV